MSKKSRKKQKPEETPEVPPVDETTQESSEIPAPEIVEEEPAVLEETSAEPVADAA